MWHVGYERLGITPFERFVDHSHYIDFRAHQRQLRAPGLQVLGRLVARRVAFCCHRSYVEWSERPTLPPGHLVGSAVSDQRLFDVLLQRGDQQCWGSGGLMVDFGRARSRLAIRWFIMGGSDDKDGNEPSQYVQSDLRDDDGFARYGRQRLLRLAW